MNEHDAETAEIVVRVRGLTRRVGNETVLEGLDLDVRRGEIVALAGATGVGKSTLLRTILGLQPIDDGRIEIFGRDISLASAAKRADLERRRGVLFQDGALFSALNVLQNVAAPMRELTDLAKPLIDELARLKLAMVGLPDEAALKYPSELSGGMRKRAGLARALAMDPEVLFLDEPTSGLDPVGAAAFDELIAKLSQTLGLTVLMVTHDLDTIFTVCDRVVILADGRIVRDATPGDVREAPNDPWTEAYFCGRRGRAMGRAGPA